MTYVMHSVAAITNFRGITHWMSNIIKIIRNCNNGSINSPNLRRTRANATAAQTNVEEIRESVKLQSLSKLTYRSLIVS